MPKRSKNGAEDPDKTPQPERIIQNPLNRELVTIMGNMVVEAKHHHLGLQSLYEMARDWAGVVPRKWGAQLLDEKERHISREIEQVSGLKVALGYSR